MRMRHIHRPIGPSQVRLVLFRWTRRGYPPLPCPSVLSFLRRGGSSPGGSRRSRDGRIGDIEGGPVVGADIDVEKIDHFTEADAVDEISHRPGKDQGQSQRSRRVPRSRVFRRYWRMRRIAATVTAMKKTRPEQGRGPGQKPEGGAGIPHVDDVEESVDDRKAVMEAHRRR